MFRITKNITRKITSLARTDYKLYENLELEFVATLVESPPPYCPVCKQFLTKPECNMAIKPIICPIFHHTNSIDITPKLFDTKR